MTINNSFVNICIKIVISIFISTIAVGSWFLGNYLIYQYGIGEINTIGYILKWYQYPVTFFSLLIPLGISIISIFGFAFIWVPHD